MAKQQTFKTQGVANGGRQYWRLPKTLASYGAPLTLKFSSGHTRVITDSSKRIADSNGLIVRPGTSAKGRPEDGSTITSHGGMFVHAPFGDRSTELTLIMAIKP